MSKFYCEICDKPIPKEEVRTMEIGGKGFEGGGTIPGNYDESALTKGPNLPPGAHELWSERHKTHIDKWGNFTDKKTIMYHISNGENMGDKSEQ